MIEVAVALLIRHDSVWTRLRRETGHLDGFWEFPGGKLEAGESPLEALLREVGEETGLTLDPQVPRLLLSVPYTYPERQVHIHFFLCPLQDSHPAGEGRWTPLAQLREEDFPPANRPALLLLKPPVEL